MKEVEQLLIDGEAQVAMILREKKERNAVILAHSRARAPLPQYEVDHPDQGAEGTRDPCAPGECAGGCKDKGVEGRGGDAGTGSGRMIPVIAVREVDPEVS
jgi:hypothetical protein